MKSFPLFFLFFLLSCTSTNETNFLDRERVLIDKILLSDLHHFDTLPKDSFIVCLRPFIWCGNDEGIYVNGNPLYDKVKNRAITYGFKNVLLDTADVRDINQKGYKYLPHYNLIISMGSDKALIQQTYYYHSGPMVIQTIRDTTINL